MRSKVAGQRGSGLSWRSTSAAKWHRRRRNSSVFLRDLCLLLFKPSVGTGANGGNRDRRGDDRVVHQTVAAANVSSDDASQGAKLARKTKFLTRTTPSDQAGGLTESSQAGPEALEGVERSGDPRLRKQSECIPSTGSGRAWRDASTRAKPTGVHAPALAPLRGRCDAGRLVVDKRSDTEGVKFFLVHPAPTQVVNSWNALARRRWHRYL